MTDPRAAISSWSPMVQQIKAGSESAVDELYSSIRSIRFFLFRQIGPDHAEDAYHAVIVDLVSAIRKGGLRDPETLPAFAMTIARRKVYERIRQAVRERQSLDVDSVVLPCNPSESPEQLAIRSERQAIAKRVLQTLPARHRETLTRFYMNEETAEEIQAAMGLTDNQFRLIKSRAKSRYTELVQQSMNRAPKTANSVNLGGLGDKQERPENPRCIPALTC